MDSRTSSAQKLEILAKVLRGSISRTQSKSIWNCMWIVWKTTLLTQNPCLKIFAQINCCAPIYYDSVFILGIFCAKLSSARNCANICSREDEHEWCTHFFSKQLHFGLAEYHILKITATRQPTGEPQNEKTQLFLATFHKFPFIWAPNRQKSFATT